MASSKLLFTWRKGEPCSFSTLYKGTNPILTHLPEAHTVPAVQFSSVKISEVQFTSRIQHWCFHPASRNSQVSAESAWVSGSNQNHRNTRRSSLPCLSHWSNTQWRRETSEALHGTQYNRSDTVESYLYSPKSRVLSWVLLHVTQWDISTSYCVTVPFLLVTCGSGFLF